MAASIRAQLTAEVRELRKRGLQPGLAVILAGDHPASKLYVRNKVRACEETGVRSELHEFPAAVPQAQVLERIAALNADPAIDGILVQLPLPGQVDEARALAAVSPRKDVDGFHVESLGALVAGRPGFVACTPAGIMKMLEHEGIELRGRHAVVVGRSTIVGKPVALLLLQKDATVTICHSRTLRLAELTRQADVLVAAAGKANLITADMVKPGACVIDVGMNRLADGRLVGDVDYPAVKDAAGWITPVPGGVGPMTVAMLIANTVRSIKERTA